MILDKLLDLEKTPAARTYSDKEYDLDGFQSWVASLGSPHTGQSFVHVAGTKGKGSTSAITDALLGGQGFATAAYNSPHLTHFGERYRFDRIPWTTNEFEAALTRLVDSLDPASRLAIEEAHSYRTAFEFLTLLGLVEFNARQGRLPAGRRQVVCWETGVGGRLDCTNVVDPVVSVITAIGYDHMSLLGNTLEAIAGEKAGIIKPGRPVVISRQPAAHEAAVLPVIRAAAARIAAPVFHAWEFCPVKEFEQTAAGLRVRMTRPDGREESGLLPLHGAFQLSNLEAAASAAWLTTQSLLHGPVPELLAGLRNVRWPGRVEVVGSAPQVLILDGAHCPLSARALGSSLEAWLANGSAPFGGKFELLWSMQRDKKHAAFLQALREVLPRIEIACVRTYPLAPPRGADPETMAVAARSVGFEAVGYPTAAEALSAARATGHDIVSAGTLYSIAQFRDLWLAGAVNR